MTRHPALTPTTYTPTYTPPGAPTVAEKTIRRHIYCVERRADGSRCRGRLLLRWSPSNRLYWECQRPDCNGRLPAWPNGAPRGKPRSRELQRLRHLGHRLFDPLWKEGHMTYDDAREFVGEVLGINPNDVHFGKMRRPRCWEVVLLLAEVWEDREIGKPLSEVVDQIRQESVRRRH